MKQLEEFFQSKIRIVQVNKNKFAISLPMYKVEGGLYELYLVAEDGKFYLSDEGTTMTELDRIFDIEEVDTKKILISTMRQYGCKNIGQKIIIECTPQDIHIKLSLLIQAISFLLNMKIFYV